MIKTMTKAIILLSSICVILITGCAKEKEVKVEKKQKKEIAIPRRPKTARDKLDIELLAINKNYNGKVRVGKNRNGVISSVDLSNCGVTNISPLKDLPLTGLDISKNDISDISPIEGMQIPQLFLENTLIQDLSPLKGMPLKKLYIGKSKVTNLAPLQGISLETLNISGCKISDLTALKEMPLKYLWLNESKVIDISPITNCPLISLTLHKTKIKDITPLKYCKTLRQLHIGNTKVKDISPIKDLQLTWLIYSTRMVTNGLEITKQMPSLQEIGTTLENKRQPEKFWALYYKQ